MKVLDVPRASISEVKNNPTEIFKKAESQHTGVYIFNRNDVAGVMLTEEQYKYLNDRINELEEQNLYLEVQNRLEDSHVKIHSDEEVRGKELANQTFSVDEDDGWE